MARVEFPPPADLVLDSLGNVLSGRSVTAKLTGTATNVTHWSALTGGTSTTGGLFTYTDGTIVDGSNNRRYVDSGITMDITIAGRTRQVEASSGASQTAVSPKAHGGDPTGAVDASTAIAAALATGHPVDLGGPENTWRIDTRVDLASNAKLIGRGATINYTNVALTSSARVGVRGQGTVGSHLPLTVDAVKGEYAVTISSGNAATLAVGDWVQLSTTGANYYPYAGGVNTDRGEIKKIFSIAAGVVTFEQGIYDAYTIANTGGLRKLTMVNDVHIEGVRFVGTGVANQQNRAVVLDYCNGFTVTNCVFEDADVYACISRSSIRGDISHNRFRGVYYDGVTGVSFYAVAIYDSSQWIRIHSNHAERVRHLFVNSSQSAGQTFWGAPRFITCTGNTAMNMMGGAGGRSWAFEHHGFGNGVVVSNNVIDGCYGGCVIRGPGFKFIGNQIKNWYQYALHVASDGVDLSNVQIENNSVGLRSIEGGGAATPVGIYVDLTNATTLDLAVRGNRIECDKAAVPWCQVLGSVSGKGLVIEDNRFVCKVTPSTWVMQVTPTDVLIDRNKFYNTSYGIRALGTNATITSNHLIGVGAGTGDFIFSDVTGHLIDGNRGRSCNFGVRLASGANTCTVTNNVMDSNSEVNAYNFGTGLTGLTQFNNRTLLTSTSSVASGATITLPPSSEIVPISGTADITAINVVGHRDRRVTLRFISAKVTTGVVDNGTTLNLAGNFAYTANSTLTLACDGTNWYEIGRSIN